LTTVAKQPTIEKYLLFKKSTMFSPAAKETQKGSGPETFIGPSVKLEGNFSAEGDVVVEGILMGTLTTQGDVKVGPQATIEAEVRAKNAYIAGRIKGNVMVSNSLRIASTAIILGDIKTLALSVEEGAQLNGKLFMSREKFQKVKPEEKLPERPQATRENVATL
jgi:cytoskeletal protein CcmA (bactofilin family)